MGLLTSSIRLTYLNNFRSDLEYKISLISSSRLNLVSSTDELLNVTSDLDPKSPEAKSLEKRRERLHQIEKKLEEQMTRYQTQLKMVEGEIQQVQTEIDSSIQRAYS